VKLGLPGAFARESRSNGVKVVILRLLERLGLLLPAYRVWERARTVFSTKTGEGYDGLPLPPPNLMVPVAGTVSAAWFLESGQLSEELIRGALKRAGTSLGSLDGILDFGCGCGRVLRRWRESDVRICGCDISHPAVDWCQKHLPFIEVRANALEPPLPYASASFDLIYALSVLTHLPIEKQLAWCDEFCHLLRPGGLLLLTLHGDAYIDRLRSEERRIYDEGNCVVRWAQAAGSNLCTTFHPLAFVSDQLSRGWELVEHVPRGAIGSPGQDLVVLRKPR
jgi:SAM-dependent methyltransferase